jgi:predicted TIM-barrel fold metal-dependent hydrolase
VTVDTPSPGPDIGEHYLRWARALRPHEVDLRDEVLSRLPERLVDCHTHSSPRHAYRALTSYGWAQARSSFPIWTKEQSTAVQDLLYGDRKVSRLSMAHPFRGFDHPAANAALLENTQPPDAVVLCGCPDDIELTARQLRTGDFRGLKMYAAHREPPYARLDEFFPDAILELATDLDVPVVVHLPVSLAYCVDDVVALAQRHPDLVVVLAHLGRQTVADDRSAKAWGRVAQLPGIHVDTSMATDLAVHREVLQHLGIDRVLYGSDEPFNLLRYTSFEHHTLGRRLMAPERYHWIHPELFAEYQDLALGASLVHLQVLAALLDAVDAHSTDVTAKPRVFHDNAVRVFGLTEQNP